ncbi:tripartite tricarboxylate transporter permease [Bacillus sp. Marseille-P3661]|uniref:tripartite tricarboxylate transporter permease n=1 Tax=Bacillus sp. Marseille-P3661 TaxID=1936234 RepID=UPI000C8676B2|nr:tripartite tricarboxylate transporter permease [Bacillus sp. Marseille-P3661]
MDYFLQALPNLLDIRVLLILIGGVTVGICIGSLPGLTATMGVALILPVTFGMGPITGILLLVGVYFGAIYGGSIAAILLRTPGTPASAATAIDGYALAQKGFAQKALTVSTISSAIGGVISVFILILIAPQLAEFALKFSAPESFALAVFGMSVISGIAGNSLVKGFIMCFIGLLIASIGIDPVGGFPRFNFGSTNLMSGVNFIAVMIGLFAASEAFQAVEDSVKEGQVIKTINKAKLKWAEFKTLIVTILRSTGIGTFIGMIPGAGGDISAFVAYNEAKRFAKKEEKFGEGELKGIAAPEAANNGTTGGAMIPLLTLGIPGDAVTAVMLGALMVQGLQPGPLLFQHHPDVVYTLFLGMLLANIIMLIVGLLAVRWFIKVLSIPKLVIAAIILVLCVVGSYALGNNMFDVWVMLIFGIIGYFMKKHDYPASPVILALILGPMMESNFRRSLLMGNGDMSIFLSRPISATLIALAVLTLFTPIVKDYINKKREARNPNLQG